MPSALAAGEAATTRSAVRSVWASPLYRGATIALFLSGLGTSAAAPQITLFLVNDLHVSLTTAGLFYLTNITAPLAGYLIGARSDRSGNRLGLFRWCALAGFLGWVVGPVLGSILATAAGSRVMLAATGSCALAQIVPMGFARTGPARPGAHTATASEVQAERPAQRPKLRETLPLLAFTGLYVFVYAGEPIKTVQSLHDRYVSRLGRTHACRYRLSSRGRGCDRPCVRRRADGRGRC
jgi:MFS transporter, SET family, sugar efflux transporter